MEVRQIMAYEVLKIGDAARVTSYGAFQGLRGTIQRVHYIACTAEDEEPFLFYQLMLENAHIKEPIWFQGEEIDTLDLQ
jgi:hypothetical protein